MKKDLATAQQHLIPKVNEAEKLKNIHIGSVYNKLDDQKIKYIINMRKSLCNNNIVFEDGSLNLKYFNVKKGHYWSQKENEKLV